MVAGHFGFPAMVKSREKSAPLWALMLATVWLDIVFIPLILTHREVCTADSFRVRWHDHSCQLHALDHRDAGVVRGPRSDVSSQTGQESRIGHCTGQRVTLGA